MRPSGWMRPRLSALALAAFAVLSVPKPVRAQEPTPDETIRASLKWERTPEAIDCIDRDEVILDVNERLGRTVFVERREDVRIEGAIGRAAPSGKWMAVITMRSP